MNSVRIVPDDKDKPAFEEEPLARLLEAAFVLQEHRRKWQKPKPPLEPQEAQVTPREQSVPALPGDEVKTQATILSPAPTPAVVSSPASPLPEELFLAQPKPAKPATAKAAASDDFAFTLAQIVGTQDQIRMRHLELKDAVSLVAERLPEIARADGAAIVFLEGDKVRYTATSGRMTLSAGTELPVEKALCVACLRAGQVIRGSNLNAEFLLDVDECQRRGILSLIAVPIYHEGGIAGGLEIYYATPQTFTDQNVHTCQLMAGLITEALAHDQELNWKKSVASERALMLEALERLKPSLAALVETSAAKKTVARSAPPAELSQPSPAPVAACRKCGHQPMAGEQFCGKCGTPRSDSEVLAEEHGASLLQMQEELKEDPGSVPANDETAQAIPLATSDAIAPEKPLADSIQEEMPELFAELDQRIGNMSSPEAQEDLDGPPVENTDRDLTLAVEGEPQDDDDKDQSDEKEEPAAATALAKPEPAPNWSSASAARQFLEQLAGAKRHAAFTRFWNARRGDIYLAIAVVLVAAVIRWGIWSGHSVGATANPTTTAAGHRKTDPDAGLSMFDRMLISLGLAEAPPVPEYKGNPDTQVWVDLRTALYYCPGADLYGKTPKGKFTTQRNAQLDQFEPASRKACD